MLARWGDRSHCPSHGRGGSHDIIRILGGLAIQTDWYLSAGKMTLIRDSNLVSGDTVATQADCVHSMDDADANDPLVTLQMYSRAMSGMNIDDRTNRINFRGQGDAGTWRLESQSRVLAKRSGLIWDDEF